MSEWWVQNVPEKDWPMKYLNKDNHTIVDSGPSTAATQAFDNAKGGITKLVELAGAVFQHKDTYESEVQGLVLLT